uniref:Uncharacterized protein n=1 Tax=Pakpunavirus sp. TaxID=2833053 RepID=A0AB39BZT5_9CAUD
MPRQQERAGAVGAPPYSGGGVLEPPESSDSGNRALTHSQIFLPLTEAVNNGVN